MANKQALRWQVKGIPFKAVDIAAVRTINAFNAWKSASAETPDNWEKISAAHRAYRNCARAYHYMTEMVEYELVNRNGQVVVVLPNDCPYRDRDNFFSVTNDGSRVARTDVTELYRAIDSLGSRGESQYTYSDLT